MAKVQRCGRDLATQRRLSCSCRTQTSSTILPNMRISSSPIVNGKADVVFGSRFQGSGTHRVLYYWHAVGNTILTTLSNICTDINLTDMETGYKVFRREIIQRITIEEDGFGFEPEITAKIAKLKGIRIYEVPISYYGRTYEEGKKIGWRDGFMALWCILKYNLFRRG